MEEKERSQSDKVEHPVNGFGGKIVKVVPGQENTLLTIALDQSRPVELHVLVSSKPDGDAGYKLDEFVSVEGKPFKVTVFIGSGFNAGHH